MEIYNSGSGLNQTSAAQLYSILAGALVNNNTAGKVSTIKNTAGAIPAISTQNVQLLEAIKILIAEQCKTSSATNNQFTTTDAITQSTNTSSVNESTPPLGLGGFSYGSISNNNPHLIIPPASDEPYILAAIGTPPKAGELYMARTANLFNDDWKTEVKNAIEKNGGLGSATEGYLAFSKIGFVRLNNTNLTTEQNRKLAAISLQLGIPVEDLPSRSKSSVSKPEINSWVENFLTEHQTKLTTFLQNPSAGYSIEDGRHLYQTNIDAQNGIVTSGHERLHGGIRGWCAKNMKWLSPTLDLTSKITSFIPGWGTVASLVSSGLKAAGNMISVGKFKASELWSFVADAATSFKLPVGKWGNQAVDWLVQKTGIDAKVLKETIKTAFKIDAEEILSKLTKIEEENSKENTGHKIEQTL